MKKTLIIVVVLAIVAVLVYTQRHALKSMMGMSPTPTQAEKMVVSPTSAMPSNNIYMSKTDATKGAYLTDFAGMTLYTFDKDTTGVSNCAGACVKAWPPYSSGATAQKEFPTHISVITRTDGTKQFAWDGKPLYYFASDTKAGDLTGDGVGGVWHIVKP